MELTLKRGSSLSRIWICLFLLFSLQSCAPRMALFDQVAYQNATDLKVEAIDLMGKATDDFSMHKTEVANFRMKLDKAAEYDFHRPKNEITNSMFKILTDPDGGSVAHFFKRWEDEKKLSPGFVKTQQTLIGRQLDQVAELEISKIHK
jgi:hypothetical protein